MNPFKSTDIKNIAHPFSDEELEKYLIDPDKINPITSESLFNNKNPLHIEIGCGNGHFLHQRSINYPDINFIGIELSKKRVVKSMTKAVKRSLPNARYLYGEGTTLLNSFFLDKSVDCIYLNFPDPWPKKRHAKHRIVNLEYMDAIYNKLIPGGIYFSVSDDEPYFMHILKSFESDKRFKNAFSLRYYNYYEPYEVSLYEEKWREEGRNIHYLKFIKKIA